jgi:hypothetical protein
VLVLVLFLELELVLMWVQVLALVLMLMMMLMLEPALAGRRTMPRGRPWFLLSSQYVTCWAV